MFPRETGGWETLLAGSAQLVLLLALLNYMFLCWAPNASAALNLGSILYYYYFILITSLTPGDAYSWELAEKIDGPVPSHIIFL